MFAEFFFVFGHCGDAELDEFFALVCFFGKFVFVLFYHDAADDFVCRVGLCEFGCGSSKFIKVLLELFSLLLNELEVVL